MAATTPADEGKPASGRALFLVRHRRALRMLAQVGCALCVLRGLAGLFGLDRPTDGIVRFLILGNIILYYCGTEAAEPRAMNEGWLRVPAWVRRSLGPAVVVCWGVPVVGFFLKMLTGLPSNTVHHRTIVAAGGAGIALFYAFIALFFEYGELKKDPGDQLPE